MTAFESKLEELTQLALENIGEKHDYTDMQLSDAMVVFMEVFFSKMHDYNKAQDLTFEQQSILAEEAGKSLRQTVQLFTGVDMHEVLKSSRK